MKLFKLAVVVLVMLQNPFAVAAQEGNWQVIKTKNEIADINECGMAAVNGKLYLIGGDAGSPQQVKCFDPKTSTWTMLAPAPLNMHHFQAVAYGKNIYVLEAFSAGGFPNQEPMANVYVYDTENNTWQKGGEMPADRRRAGAGAAVYKGKLYLACGIQHGHASGTTNMFDVYDPATATWSSLPDAPHIRDHCSAAVIKDKLYVVGGRNTSYRDPDNIITFFSQTIPDVDCYDFSTGKWSTLSAKLPLGSGGGAAVNLDGMLYYMGGERATATERNAPRKNVYYLDPASQNQWAAADSMHFARNGMAAAVLNHKIYAAGGSGGGPGIPPAGFNPYNMHPRSKNDSANNITYGPPPDISRQNQQSNLVIEVFRIK